MTHGTTYLKRKDNRLIVKNERLWERENGKQRNYTDQTKQKGENATTLH